MVLTSGLARAPEIDMIRGIDRDHLLCAVFHSVLWLFLNALIVD